jgi:hypothetical protein
MHRRGAPSGVWWKFIKARIAETTILKVTLSESAVVENRRAL